MKRRTLLVCSFLIASAARVAVAATPDATAELRRVSDAYNHSTATMSADSVVSYFDADVVVMSPQGRQQPARGREANRAAWQRFFSAKNPVHTMTTDTVVVARGGDMGYTLGHWTVGMDLPDGPRAEAAGQYLAVWHRVGHDWKIAALTAYTFR